MKIETVNKIIKHLKSIKETGVTIEQYQELNNLSSSFIRSKIRAVKKADLDKDKFNEIMNLYESIKIHKDKKVNETDNRATINITRDENGKINAYNFEIYVRDKEPIIGTLTRDEMALIYRLYSSYGSNITQREVSRFFPEYSLYDFKRILRTFNITKASSPFPPHIIEECSKEQLLEMQIREKENDFLKSYEVEKVRQLDLQCKKYLKENADLKSKLQSFSNITVHVPEPIIYKGKNAASSKDLYIYLSDMHIGANVGENSLYDNNYDAKEVAERLQKVLKAVYTKEGYDNIIVCNIGDSLDGSNNQTTRGGHYLPQNMDDKQQIQCFINVMVEFFVSLGAMPHNNIYYYAVGESNHGGTYEYASQLALSKVLQQSGVVCTVFDKFIGFFTHKNRTHIICHGKQFAHLSRN